jgi:HK97 family phage portal protein
VRLGDRVSQTVKERAARRAADPSTLEELGVLLARNAGLESRAGVTVTDRRVMGLTAWYSGVRYLSESVAFLPVHAYRDVGTLERPKRQPRANPPWVERTDDELPWPGWVEFAMYSLLNRGNSFSLKVRDGVERVIGLQPVHPDNIRGRVATEATNIFGEIVRPGRKVFWIRQDAGFEWLPLTSRDVFHIPGLSTDGKFGLNPIRALAESLGGIAAAEEASQRYYANAAYPGGVISVPQELTPDERDRMKAEWDEFHRGLKNRERTGVLSKGATYDALGLKAEDAQLIQVRQWGVVEISQALRIPPHKLYELTRATYSNIEQQSIESVVDSVRPWCERIEAWTNFDRDLVPVRNFIEFALEGLLRGDSKARSEFYRNALGGHPWMMVSEPRRLENLPEVEGVDLDFIPEPLNTAQGRRASDVGRRGGDAEGDE